MMELFERPADLAVGYWGERTSAVDWCESNYTHSYYIAEFWNTITSLPAAFLALYGLYLGYKYGYDRRFIVVNAMVGLVGFGSAAFHGTLLWTGQIMDELPMVYASIAFLWAVMEMESNSKPVYKYLAPALLVYSLIFTGVYLYLPSFFIFFLVGYIGAILLLVYRCSLIFRKPETRTSQKVLVIASVGFYIGGWLFFWIPEVAFCDKIQALQFHAWWHVTSTFGGFAMVLFTVLSREIHRGRKPQLNYNSLMGVPLLPYVHIPAASEKKDKEEPKENSNESVKSEKRRKLDASNEFASFRR